MQCPKCGKVWPDEYQGCPICMVPFGDPKQPLPPNKNAAAAQRGAGHTAPARMDAPIAADHSIAAQRDVYNAGGDVIIAGEGAKVIIGEPEVQTPAVAHDAALSRYLRHLISRNRYLRLQGIRSGGKLVSIELERIYITLRATRKRTITDEERWLAEEVQMAPGEAALRRRSAQPPAPGGAESRTHIETITVSVNEALAEHLRLVVLGDPGSGKTTLLRYLALCYARDLAEGSTLVREQLGIAESGYLPVLIPLRRLGAYLRTHRPQDDGTEGHAHLLQYLYAMLQAERIDLPPNFFDAYLEAGQAVILLDGLDEVADPKLRQRVARLVEAFTAAYPHTRYVVSSRVVGYTGAARLGEAYTTTTIRDFRLEDVRQFLNNWHLAVAVGQMGPGESAMTYAGSQTQQLLEAIEANDPIRELAINPLMLTVIALVHRDRVKLPDRRAELYDEAVNVLLGKWDEAKDVPEIKIFEDRPFDIGDRRLILQAVALWMHEKEQKEIETADLRRLLGEQFHDMVGDWKAVSKVVDRFLAIIRERTGLLAEHGVGVYRFSHLTFQEYLAALAVAARDDYIQATLQHCGDPWWREVVLLQAGYLSMHSKERTTRLIQALADCAEEPEPYHNLVLAADCLRDVGAGRVKGDLEGEVQRRLRKGLETRPPFWSRWLAKIGARGWTERRSAAMEALVRAGAGYWYAPYGEPEWVEIPAGPFWMGENPSYRAEVAAFLISRVPITNAQYHVFVKATGHAPPRNWENNHPPRGKESHPVVEVTWHDATAYCQWLSKVTGKKVTLPSEPEWEKAARGNKDKRMYPWGDEFEVVFCNSSELGLGDTTPVGIFPDGASPYGVLDMAGNVWEWTRSKYQSYPYDPNDGREDLKVTDETAVALRVLRGGAFDGYDRNVRCASRYWDSPSARYNHVGFRVVASPSALRFGSSVL